MRQLAKTWSTLIFVVMMLVAVSACTADEPAATSAVGNGAAPTTGGEIDVPTTSSGSEDSDDLDDEIVTVALQSFGNENLDPGRGVDIDMIYYGAQFDHFVGTDREGVVSAEYGALTDWEVSEDGTEWDFTLREGMTWHNGDPVTVDDAIFSFERYASDDATCTRCAAIQLNVESVTATGDNTFRVTLNESDYLFVDTNLLPDSDIILLPKDHWESVGGSEGFNREPMGSGPWKFVDREIGQFIEYEANSDYWNEDAVPKFSRLRIDLAPEASSRIALVSTGEADLAQMPPDLLKEAEQAELTVRLIPEVYTISDFFYRSWDDEYPSSLEEVRKAVNLAIDREGVVAAVYGGESATVTASEWAPLHDGFDPNLTPYPYDPDEARRLLQSVGLEGLDVVLHQYGFAAVPELPAIQEAIAGYLNAAGFNAQLVPVDFAAVRPGMLNLEGQRLVEPGVLSINPLFRVSAASVAHLNHVQYASLEAGGNHSAFWDPETLDPMIVDYVSEPDAEARTQIAEEIQQYVYSTYGTVPLVLVDQVWISSGRIADWQPTLGNPKDLNYETLTPSN